MWTVRADEVETLEPAPGESLDEAQGVVGARQRADLDAVPHAATAALPPEIGRFRLVFDLVAEQICWFEHHGSPGLVLDLETKA